MSDGWLASLLADVEQKPCVVLRFEADDWRRLLGSRHGASEFTSTRPHGLLKGIKLPTLCLIFGQCDGTSSAHCGFLGRRRAVSTLDTRIKVRSGFEVSLLTEQGLVELIEDSRIRNLLVGQLASPTSVVGLTPRVSVAAIEALAAIPGHEPGFRSLAGLIAVPKSFSDNAALQEDAVQTALKAFGIAPTARPIVRDLSGDRQTALARIPMMEDAVIEHDARWIPGFELIQSDVTGRARFAAGDEELEVFTANRRPLEETFGVDLIYLNLTRHNIVMVQYKMLDRSGRHGEDADWVYRPDAQLEEEIRRMEVFAAHNSPGELEYRLNPAVFFLKFVKRDAAIKDGGIVRPLDHYRVSLNDPRCMTGERGGIRVSFKSLGGRYLRETAFLDLLRSGYIGAYAETTRNFTTLVEAVLASNRAVVGAVVTPRAQ